ncbi:AhpD-like protein [Mycena galopus ATCC 62051]|nr:AhpD-like protein [Mycena galopus ATCC 62051]
MASSNRPNEQAHQEIYEAGMEFRRKVMGDEYVDNQLKKGVSEFMKPMQELTTEVAWGTIWTRPGLELKQRSLIVLAILASQGKAEELAGHVRGSHHERRNGAGNSGDPLASRDILRDSDWDDEFSDCRGGSQEDEGRMRGSSIVV